VFFSVGFIEKPGNEISAVHGNFAMTDRTNPFQSRFRHWKTMGAAVDCTKLMRNVHGTVNPAD
jgi:hypothetical protein